jgi:Tfp pilus assembly protein PilE
MTKKRRNSGFTAVELLITLFVAAAFLIAAYQLFNVVIRDGGIARAESRAGNVAYDYLRRYAGTTTNPCTASTPLSNYGVTISGLTNAAVTVNITCPYSATSTLSEIEAIITYNDPQETVRYTTYSYGESGGASNDILQGLIAWWPFNGNANSSVGALNGTVFGASPTTGQNGQPNNAYNFDGTSNYISVADSDALSLGDFTLSAWIQTTGTNAARVINKEATSGSNYGILIVSLKAYFFVDGTWGSHYIANVGPNLNDNNWNNVVATRSGSTLYLYVNGVQIGTRPSSTTATLDNTAALEIGRLYTSSQYFPGKIDDVRIYGRALSSTEVQTLYTNGAK